MISRNDNNGREAISMEGCAEADRGQRPELLSSDEREELNATFLKPGVG
jgi:hypothetical protein